MHVLDDGAFDARESRRAAAAQQNGRARAQKRDARCAVEQIDDERDFFAARSPDVTLRPFADAIGPPALESELEIADSHGEEWVAALHEKRIGVSVAPRQTRAVARPGPRRQDSAPSRRNAARSPS